ncbi:hypothetical protein EV175_004580, partial [Coemansia sp. RSA 1933]
MYAFPVPPMGNHDTATLKSVHEAAVFNGCDKKSVVNMDPLAVDESGPSFRTCELLQLEQENHCISQFKRFSKSTASLPIIMTHFPDDGQATRSSIEAHVLNTARLIESESNNGHGAGTGKVMSTVRAARSHHNLNSTKNNHSYSQSVFSLESKDEPMQATSGFISPTKSAHSHKSNGETSSGTITLVSYAYGQQPPPPSDKSGVPCAQQETDTQGCFSGQSLFPVPLPRRQYSMAQVEARLSNRNSMFVSDALFSSIASNTGDSEQQSDGSSRLAGSQRHEKVTIDTPFDIDPSRTSRYLYNVPSGSFRSSVHGPLAKALQWPQRISNSTPLRLRPTRSSVITQHKIYDIYEEAIWHTSRTPQKSAEKIKIHADKFLSSKNAAESKVSDSENLSRSRILHKKASAIGAFATTRLKSLGSVRASGISWDFLRSWKPRGELQEGPGDWYDPTSIPTSYSDNIEDDDDDDSDSDSDVSLFRTSANNAQERKPARKPSTIQMFVKRAGIGLLRRSTSFYKSISGTSTDSSGPPNKSMLNTCSKYNTGISSADVCASDSTGHTMRSRLANAMRQASGKIHNHLKYLDKNSTSHRDKDADIVSAYPTDSVKAQELDSYLSHSAIHSPMISSSDDSGASDPQGMPSSDETVCYDQEVVETLGGRYVPPKRPPYLGLHRKTARNSVAISCHGMPLAAAPREGGMQANPIFQPSPLCRSLDVWREVPTASANTNAINPAHSYYMRTLSQAYPIAEAMPGFRPAQ